MATLLLADDSVTIQRVIELTFADEGVRVIAVGHGETAIERIDQDRPDIVLADVGLPGVDGYQIATHVKQSQGQSNVPVLLLTGAFEPIDEARARDTGCDGVLVKPFEPRQLIKTVRDLLAGSRSPELWPADMPRLETLSPRPGPVAAPPVAPPPAAVSLTPEPELSDDPNVVSISYDGEGDTDLTEALARLELIAVPDSPPVESPVQSLEPLESLGADAGEWDLSSASGAGQASRPSQPPANQSLSNVFSALLAAERRNPEARASIAASPALTEAAVQEVVKKVVREMTDEVVRKIVLETAERLIREEIDRIKA